MSQFTYLGSVITRNCRDTADVETRIKKAGNAFGALRKCLFASTQVSFAAKKMVYMGLILSILLYGSESWSLTENLYQQLRRFHARCVRTMCRVSLKHTREYRLSTSQLLLRLELPTIDSCITKRQLRWVGHVARMENNRLPRKFLSSWVRSKRPRGCPQFTYGRGLKKSLRKANVDLNTWQNKAMDKESWRSMINAIM